MTDPDEHVCANGAAHMGAWRIFQVGPLRYVAGRRVAADKDGVTTPVIRLDTANLAVLTLSGSVYLLVGPPRLGPEPLEHWVAYCRRFQIDKWQDVTDEIWHMHLAALPFAQRQMEQLTGSAEQTHSVVQPPLTPPERKES